jgi:hypothetical protein
MARTSWPPARTRMVRCSCPSESMGARASGWIEGESRLAGQLRDRVLAGRPYALLDEPLCDHVADGLGPAFGKTTGCQEA